MTLWKRVKNLWKLSEWDLNHGDTFQIRKIDESTSAEKFAQFIEPVGFKERFTIAKNVDDLLE